MNSYFTRRRLLFVCLHRACVRAAAAADECTAINPSKADAANERCSLYDLPLLRARRFKAITVSAQLQALITAPAPRRGSVGAVPELSRGHCQERGRGLQTKRSSSRHHPEYRTLLHCHKLSSYG